MLPHIPRTPPPHLTHTRAHTCTTCAHRGPPSTPILNLNSHTRMSALSLSRSLSSPLMAARTSVRLYYPPPPIQVHTLSLSLSLSLSLTAARTSVRRSRASTMSLTLPWPASRNSSSCFSSYLNTGGGRGGGARGGDEGCSKGGGAIGQGECGEGPPCCWAFTFPYLVAQLPLLSELPPPRDTAILTC